MLAISKTRVSLPGINLDPKEQALRDEVFWEELESYPIEKIEKAFRRARRELKFFPKPAEIIGFILEEDEMKFQQRQVVSGDYQLAWMSPTKEGKEMAAKMIQELQDRWEKEDREKKREKDKEFEESRKRLKKQAKLIGTAKA